MGTVRERPGIAVGGGGRRECSVTGNEGISRTNNVFALATIYQAGSLRGPSPAPVLGSPEPARVFLPSGTAFASLLPPTRLLGPNECYRVALSKSLLWATSGAWAENGALFVVDALLGKVLVISADGEVATGLANESASTPGSVGSKPRRPSMIRTIDGEYLLKDEMSAQILHIDSFFNSSSSSPVNPRVVAEDAGGQRKGKLQRIYDWSPLGDGYLAFGDLEKPKGEWYSAFLYFDSSGRQQIFKKFAVDDQVCNHYLRDMPYIATLGDVGYILFLDERPKIGEVRVGIGDVQELKSFPKDFQNRPRLESRLEWTTTGQGPKQATYFYEILEHSTMAAGLYAWKGYLYLLAKKAAENGETPWWLIKLDPHREAKEISRVRLPTKASHLTVVPGDFWALIEKGPVQGIGQMHAPYMEISSMVLVPAPWIERPEDGRLHAGQEAECLLRRPEAGRPGWHESIAGPASSTAISELYSQE